LLARLLLGRATQLERLVLTLEDDLLLLACASATIRWLYCSACLIALVATNRRATKPITMPTTTATAAATTTATTVSGIWLPRWMEPGYGRCRARARGRIGQSIIWANVARRWRV
jgi:hypothetical protein